MSFVYKNPISPLVSLGNISVNRSDVFGTNFSILNTGGYMEVYSLNDLYYTIPSGTTGLIEFTGNTIPIQFQKGTGFSFSPDVLTLNSDNISSGRRRIGMLVYVIDEDQIYQYQIPNFDSLWSAVTSASGVGGSTVVISDFGTTVKGNSPEGISFISSWTANTIDGISGETSSTAVWKKFNVSSSGSGSTISGDYLPLSGGTVTGDTVFTSGLTADTLTFTNTPSQPIIEGRLGWNDTDGTLDLGMKGGNVTQQIGMEQFIRAKSLTNSGIQEGYVYYLTGSTGGNKNVLLAQSNDSNTSKSTIGVATESSTGGSKAFITTFGLVRGLPDSLFVGINEGDTLYLSDTTPGRFQSTVPTQPNHRIRIGYCTRKQSNNNDIFVSVQLGLDLGELCNVYVPSPFNGDYLVYDQSNLRWKNMTPPISVTSVTFNNNTLTYTNSTGGTFTNVINTLTGLTINGNLNVTGTTTSSIISATTYQNLPLDITVTGGTYNKSTGVLSLVNNTGGTFNISGITDIQITGGTYSAGTTTFTNNTGGTFSISGYTDKQTLIMDSGTYAVSNTSVETIVRTVEITSDKWKTLAAYDLKILGQHQAAGTVTNTIRLYLNTGNTLDGNQTLIHEAFNTTNNTATVNNGTTIGIIKTLWKDGNILTYDRGNSGANLANVLGSIDIGVVNNMYQRNVFDTTFSFTSSLYLIITCQMSTAVVSHITRIKKIYLVEV